jgi:hypothetical protein
VYAYRVTTMTESTKPGDGEPFVVIFQTETPEEAVILRGLLQSGGIDSPAPTFSDPFPLPTHSEITHGTEILVKISQVEAAREILASYGEEDPPALAK